ncbi:uncharacterized protein EDB91DRAFT_1102104, partial [Suillus paluster]|uniref:uncharacterized protein n=1 Tax=Suillus paluster TaxID=48578 RepID=UPI001B87AC98
LCALDSQPHSWSTTFFSCFTGTTLLSPFQLSRYLGRFYAVALRSRRRGRAIINLPAHLSLPSLFHTEPIYVSALTNSDECTLRLHESTIENHRYPGRNPLRLLRVDYASTSLAVSSFRVDRLFSLALHSPTSLALVLSHWRKFKSTYLCIFIFIIVTASLVTGAIMAKFM